MHIQLGKTLDVAVVERELAQLWAETANDPKESPDTQQDHAVLRARVANLLVFAAAEEAFNDVRALLAELTAVHPSRVLTMLGVREAEDQDIEMSVESLCQTDKRSGGKRLSCEEITLMAFGKFVSELPSAALPLLVPDLSTFLWWRNSPRVDDKVLDTLLRATDRLIVDSVEFAHADLDLLEVNKVYNEPRYDHVGISDLNWARLTFWRGLLADFYDVPTYREHLDSIERVEIDYVAPAFDAERVAPQALLLAGWLGSRLGWTLRKENAISREATSLTCTFDCAVGNAREVIVKLNRVEAGEHKPGRLVRAELFSGGDCSFRVARSSDNLHLVADALLGEEIQRGRVLPVRNRSTAQLLSREMEILCNDKIYQESLAIAANLIS
jgi:glucose-6-phosphate dehydrogenase assembly protein OpcA